jgi:PAS domain S-box-containing protein
VTNLGVPLEREARLSEASMPGQGWSADPTGQLVYISPKTLNHIGQATENPLCFEGTDECGWRQVVHPDDYRRVGARWLHSLKTGEPYESEHRIRRFDGTYRWFRNAGMPSRDDQGRIVGWHGVLIDIEEQKQAGASREREWELSQLVDMVPIHLWRLTPDGEPIFFNKRMIDFLGLDVAQLDKPGMSRLEAVIETVIHPDDAPVVSGTLNRCLVHGEGFDMRYRLRRANGVYRWMSSRAEPMRNRNGEIVQWYGFCLDIEGEIRTQGTLRRAVDKLARAAQAANLSAIFASIAHEVNQPLAAIVAACHACRHWLSANPPNLERAKVTLERIIRDANSASEAVSRIRVPFSRTDNARSEIDITEVITQVCRVMADELAIKNIHVETEFDRSLPQVLIDPIQMEQVLINLIRNAIDAVEAIVDGTRLVRLRTVRDGDNTIRVEVRDVGPGIKEPERIFEQFFTTKANGMGTVSPSADQSSSHMMVGCGRSTSSRVERFSPSRCQSKRGVRYESR